VVERSDTTGKTKKRTHPEGMAANHNSHGYGQGTGWHPVGMHRVLQYLPAVSLRSTAG
jgi:hypothetical protein